MQKTVLLTGANGLLGQKVVQKLNGRSAVKLVALSKGHNRNLIREGYEYISGDVTDAELMKVLFRSFAFTDVVHCAAMTNVDACEKEQELCRSVNVDSVRILTDLCREYGSKFIHVSTDFIFDGEGGPYKEDDLPAPLSYYGHSKLDSEQVVMTAGIQWAIVRTVLLYGVVPDLTRTNIVLWVINELKAGRPIRVVNDQFRSPTLAEDLADGIVLVLMKDKTGIFHISGSEIMSISELAHHVAKYFELDEALIFEITSDTLSQPAKRPPKTGFIILKAQVELGYKPRTLTEGLKIVASQLAEY